MTNEELQKLVEKKVDELREHFPHVQILVTWEDEDTKNTLDIFSGKGNFYARTGMAHDFLTRDVAHVNAYELGKKLNEGEE